METNSLVSEHENIVVHSEQPNKKYKNINDFLKKHSKKPEDGSGPSHTRIGDTKSNIHGGAYFVNNNEWITFMKHYWNDIVSKNKPEYLTERQLSEDGPIAVDLDLHFAYELEKRVYEEDHLDDLVDIYLAELNQIYHFDENSAFPIFLFEKDNVNRVQEKNITKDGIHLIIGIKMDHKGQILLRERVLEKVKEAWGDFPIVNSWSDVFDEGITKGYTNWQLYGSGKPNHESYKLTQVYDITYDADDGEFVNNRGKPTDYLNAENFHKLSVRYTGNPQFFYKEAFLRLIETNELQQRRKSSPTTIQYNEISGSKHVSQIKNSEELDQHLQHFLDSIGTSDYMLREIYEYTTVLPDSYYGSGSYGKWIRVGWALKNTSNKLLIVWLAFSARSPTFDYSSIHELCEMWDTFDIKRDSGVTKRSIIYWANQDNKEGAEAIRKNTVGHYLDMTINAVTASSLANPSKHAKGSTDYDIAIVLHQMYKDEYVCADVKNGSWWRFKKHRWNEIDCGSTLRRSISTELRQMYEDKVTELQNYLVTLDPEDDQYKQVKMRIDIVLKIVQRLGQTSDKRNIMQEARDLFYDDEFLNSLDSNPYLLACKNGVVDFKTKEFRKGRPEDYLTKCTNINYYPRTSSKHKDSIPELEDFMRKLFPNTELCGYMWNHLSAVLIGMPSLNQAMYNYIGFGQNGKSVLTDLMSQTLGTYKATSPISLITQGRGKIGGLAPEIVGLKGARYVVMQEPESTDIIHEGPMKELVSGVEPITARAPYMTKSLTFIPQFALIVCCNQLMQVRTQDHGTWRRLKVANFQSLFTEQPKDDDQDRPFQYKIDRELMKKFPVWRETFLAMLVQLAFENEGRVNDCDTVLEASNKYRESQDHVAQFVGERIKKHTGKKVRKEQISEEFKMWFLTNCGKTKQPSPKSVYEYMDRMYGKNRNGTWMDVKLTYPSDHEQTQVNDSDGEIEIPETIVF